MHVWCLQGHKKASDSLDLELQRVVSGHTGAGHRSQVHWKSSQWSSPQLSSQLLIIQFFVKTFIFNLCVWGLADVCGYMWSPEVNLRCPSQMLSTMHFRGAPRSSSQASWPEPLGIFLPHSPSVGTVSLTTIPSLLCGFWGAESGPHAYVTRAVSSALGHLVIKLLIHPNEQAE